MPKRLPIILAVAVVLGGCAVGNTFDYASRTPEFATVSSTKTAAVGVQDRRSYVVSDRNTRHFVGLQRAGFGNPWGVHTTSGRPLADDFALTIVKGLKKSGLEARMVPLDPKTPRSDAIDRLRADNPDRIVFLTMVEWKTDTYVRAALHYNLVLTVLDPAGNEIARDTLSGSDNLGAVALPSQVEPLAAAAQQRKLERLFEKPEIAAALR